VVTVTTQAELEGRIAADIAKPGAVAGPALHLAACRSLGIDPVRGSKKLVAAELGITVQAYVPVAAGRATLDLVAKRAGQLDLAVLVFPTGEAVVGPVEDIAPLLEGERAETAGAALHRAACKALRIPSGHGSQVLVARELGVTSQLYGRGVAGHTKLSTVARWAGQLSLAVLVMPDGGVVVGILTPGVHEFAHQASAWYLRCVPGESPPNTRVMSADQKGELLLRLGVMPCCWLRRLERRGAM